jgi:hypothetical protein
MSHVLRLVSICDLFTDSPSLMMRCMKTGARLSGLNSAGKHKIFTARDKS